MSLELPRVPGTLPAALSPLPAFAVAMASLKVGGFLPVALVGAGVMDRDSTLGLPVLFAVGVASCMAIAKAFRATRGGRLADAATLLAGSVLGLALHRAYMERVAFGPDEVTLPKDALSLAMAIASVAAVLGPALALAILRRGRGNATAA